MPTKAQNRVPGPPAGLEVRHGYKTTEETVPLFYTFNQWYRRKVHVLPATYDDFIRNRVSYEQGVLYECEYAGGGWDPSGGRYFWLTEYVRVLDQTVCMCLMYDGELRITDGEKHAVWFEDRERLPKVWNPQADAAPKS